MTKKKKILIGLLVIFFLYILYAGVGIIRYKASFKKLKPIETELLTDGLWVIKTDIANGYILETDSGNYIAIDAGISVELLAIELEKMSIDPKKVTALFLTHTDHDHVGGASLYSNCTTYIYEQEESMIDGSASRGPMMNNAIDVPYTTLVDNQVIKIENLNVRIIAVPGHTAGSSCFLINDKYLFTGDVLKIENGNAEVFVPPFNMNTKQLRESLKILHNYGNIEMVLTGHYGWHNNPDILLEEID